MPPVICSEGKDVDSAAMSLERDFASEIAITKPTVTIDKNVKPKNKGRNFCFDFVCTPFFDFILSLYNINYAFIKVLSYYLMFFLPIN